MKSIRLPFFLIAGLSLNGPSFAAIQPVQTPDLEAQFAAIQQEKAARTPVENKMASQLLFLAREQAGLKAVDGAPDLTSRVKLEEDGRVLVDMNAVPSAELDQYIAAAGGEVIYDSVRWQTVRAVIPPLALRDLAAREDITRISRGTHRRVHTGTVTTLADTAEKVSAARAKFGANGAGISVGVVSDSSDKSSTSISKGDLPADFTVLKTTRDTGEGTAMSEIVYDLAPGAKIYFSTADLGISGFADSILNLNAAGCKIIVDDISYDAEWQFQDDAIGQAVNQVTANGALYLSAAGNEGSLKYGNSTTWEGDFLDGGAAASPLLSGRIHSFGAKKYNSLPSDSSVADLQWSDEGNTSANDYDLYILNSAGTSVVDASTDNQTGSSAPFEEVDQVDPGERIVVWKATAAAARYVRLTCFDSPLAIQTTGQSVGHCATANCVCVGAADVNQVTAGQPFTTSSALEDYSSDGPHHMFYKPDGTPFTPGNVLASGGVILQTPDLTAGDGGNTSLSSFSPFYGTSAAAPAAAAIAAVVWSRIPSLTNTQLRTILKSSCLDIESPGYDINSGYGILMADLALAQTRTPQEIWRDTKFGVVLPNGNAAPTADPDADGAANLVEYATGSDPLISGGGVLSVPVVASTAVNFDYHRNVSATDAVIGFESSTDLVTWTAITPTSDVVNSTTGGVESHTATLPKSGAWEFFRMTVTAP